jgi:ankyrin repeat protein
MKTFYIILALLAIGLNIYGSELHEAAGNGDLETVKKLLDAGTDINLTNQRGWTPLHRAAAWSCNPELVSFLIARGANVNAKMSSGITVLGITESELSKAVRKKENDRILQYRKIIAILKKHGAK